MVFIAITIKVDKRLVDDFLKTRDIKVWPTEQLGRYMRVYGDEQTIQQLWDETIDFLKAIKNGLFLTEDNPHQYLLKPEQLSNLYKFLNNFHKNIKFQNRDNQNTGSYCLWRSGPTRG